MVNKEKKFRIDPLPGFEGIKQVAGVVDLDTIINFCSSCDHFTKDYGCKMFPADFNLYLKTGNSITSYTQARKALKGRCWAARIKGQKGTVTIDGFIPSENL